MKKIFNGLSVVALVLSLVVVSLISGTNANNTVDTAGQVSPEGATLSSSTTIPSDFTTYR